MRKRRVSFCARAALALAGCAADASRVIKLAHGLPPSHPVHEAMMFFADRVRERSHGALTVDVHPSEQLGTERECVELLQIGAIAMTFEARLAQRGWSEHHANDASPGAPTAQLGRAPARDFRTVLSGRRPRGF